MKAKALMLAALCSLAVALALPPSGVGATPGVYPLHGRDVGTFTICGLDLTYDFSYSGASVIRPSGISLNAGQFRSVWTNPTTGKSIVIHGTGMGTSSGPIDNGDGTISFIQKASGAYIVKSANGAPLSLQAGTVTARITVNATTGELVSVEFLHEAGQHGSEPADSSCDSIVAALT